MKRIGNLFNRIISYENLVRAEKKARLGKTKRYGVKKFDRNPYENLVRLQKALIEDTYRTSEYCVYTIIADRGNKEREIYRLPYYPDRIVHHVAANLNLTWFDRWIKQVLKIKYYYRYCDDIVILHPDKDYLRYCLQEIEKYLADNLKLKVKRNWQIFPVEVRGIDFIGYVFYHGHTLLRKDIKKKFIHKLSYKSNNKRLASLAAYWGWCKYGNCHNLWYRFTRSYNFKDYRQKLLSDDGIKKSTG